ncbi:hypothetical protein [Micromonospora nigra]|nr:hypothetical protein [Micromonospora nigra]
MYDEWSASVRVSLAAQTVAEHENGGTCRQCTPDGCPQLEIDRPILDAHRAERAQWLAERTRR